MWLTTKDGRHFNTDWINEKKASGKNANRDFHKITDKEERKLQEISERYVTSKPVSGSWDTEVAHMQHAVSKELDVTLEQAREIMENHLGFADVDTKEKEWATSKKSKQNNDEEMKDKQIAANKKQADERNGKSKVGDLQGDVNALNDFHDAAWKYGADKDAIKVHIRHVADQLPDGTVLGRVKQETSSQYTSQGVMQSTDTQISKLYKINGQWSRYKDGSGKVNDIASEVIYNSGKLQILKNAEKEAAKLSKNDSVQTKYYGSTEKFVSSSWDKYKDTPSYKRAKEVQVNGHTYKVWGDTTYKGTFAENEDGRVLPIKGSGYLTKELSQRKAIANKFGEPTFRSTSAKSSVKKSAPKSKAFPLPKSDKNAEWKITKAYDRSSLRELALDAGLKSDYINAMTTDALRQKLLAMWRG